MDPLSRSARGRTKLDILLFSLLVLVAPATGCRRGNAAPAADPYLEDGQWPLVGKDYQNRRFSGLAEITTANVASLKVAWTF